MNTYAQVMKALEGAGTAQTRKVYERHGVTGPAFGVSYAFLKKLDKQVEYDQALADKLWDSGNHDARVFACWSAEEDKVTPKMLDRWAKEAGSSVLGGEVASLAAFTKHGASRSAKWRRMKDERRASMGWSIVANLAMQPKRLLEDGGVSDDELSGCLEQIQEGIHDAKNRVRQGMNTALIAIGCRPSMTKAALKVAKRIGPVDVDHGETSCKTFDAFDAIQKSISHYAAKGKNPTDGSGGKRRRHC
ncbi:MAG: DNA alkylation repair protein [Nannocystaceae bacterium]|nr:DNA alkylation repair protein [Nannocystaceae bacterium]